jgi:hypothetical protein
MTQPQEPPHFALCADNLSYQKHCRKQKLVILTQGRKYPERHVLRANKFYMVLSNICGSSECILLHDFIMVPGIFTCLIFLEICAPCPWLSLCCKIKACHMLYYLVPWRRMVIVF